jgi:hypothetical protein
MTEVVNGTTLEAAFVVQFGAIVVAGIAAWASIRAARAANDNKKQLEPTNGDGRPTRELIEVMETSIEAVSIAVRGNARRIDQQGREIGALEAGQTAQNEMLDELVSAVQNHQVFCAHNIDLFHGVMPGGKRRTDPPKRKETEDGVE